MEQENLSIQENILENNEKARKFVVCLAKNLDSLQSGGGEMADAPL